MDDKENKNDLNKYEFDTAMKYLSNKNTLIYYNIQRYLYFLIL